ncbi:carbamoyl-phosphate synthase, small subunit [Ehrlichia chaffeensis str. Liberty]|uniref:Carbamoyl phosphate synthase small chain n=1 Tax=Ehrlichia chaffeensis (strain ATCC CRL-10679 / Arkansas) TaxID=205920 RepID=Q2GGW5_EHRCR|nr:glutamine-hydrolyzing carbamoyl-phosphate synthase small subunit [Ehrlichia chaffeensis]ABD45433.1 carbamoyl-phosphate synthase, small subunit [Ehrlichia chaffeensis str. Arkansas]AHX06670.1 carbamoyl-phosphate synthase, small subunit [Ehrlichia chaffeensis str. Liberty]
MSQLTSYYNSILVLSDGKHFFGKSIGKKISTVGEVCFTTSMTGYQHTITDPSFAGQIITFTFPHIGNVGINYKDFEDRKILTHGIIVKTISEDSHSSSYSNLELWMIENNLTGISEIDTRALTCHLRQHGSQNGIIYHFDNINSINLAKLQKKASQYNYRDHCSSISFVNNYNSTDDDTLLYNIVVINFGIKLSILDALSKLRCKIHMISGNEDNLSEKVLFIKPQGIVLSNGPGDPSAIPENIIKQIKTIIESKIPILGICLGHQLISLALGAKIIKMLFGHRGSNHPVYNKINNNIEITSQNHGFTVKEDSLPTNVQVTHRSLFDNTIEGIQVNDYPIISVQYHPEGSPGPNDASYIFNHFINLIREND